MVRQLPVPIDCLRGGLSWEQVRQSIGPSLRQTAHYVVSNRRTPVAEFCLNEAVSFQELLHALIERDDISGVSEAVHLLTSDLPLQCLIHGGLAFLAATMPEPSLDS